jgi:putative sterol carrier protein
LDKLADIGFNSVIFCGFKNEEDPRGAFVVEKGTCVRTGTWNGEVADWDMRADRKDWMKWVAEGIGMASAYMFGKLKFRHGDYVSMIKDQRMAGPFVKSFGLMQKIGAS